MLEGGFRWGELETMGLLDSEKSEPLEPLVVKSSDGLGESVESRDLVSYGLVLEEVSST
jgi:hypothetical protein